jgi:hypothetical protein
VHEENRDVLDRLRRAFGGQSAGEEEVSRDPPARLLGFPSGKILIIDRSAADDWFPDDQGVGLARKIGVDVAVRLAASGGLGSPIVHTTDADVELPDDYFDRRSPAGAAAIVYPFAHRPSDDPSLARAVLLYEISLRYYVLGLGFAGSRWAYHTIGSTMAVDASAYTVVRGFPRRAAAEDFYLLAKLAKVGRVVSLGGRPIRIRGRASDRVPFGTGAAVTRIAALGAEPFRMYDPTLFRYLRAWLAVLDDVDEPGPLSARIAAACGDLDPAPLVTALDALDASKAIEAARRQAKSSATLARHLTTWFDAFRTLKLLHTLQRFAFPPVAWSTALRLAPFTGTLPARSEATLDELQAICSRLASMEGTTAVET